MLYRFGESDLLHVDACCWIDLFATDCLEEIIRAVPFRWVVPEYVVREEVLTVVSSAGIEENCDFTSLVSQSLVAVLPIQSATEKEALVRFASYVDDGEASVCALASIHGGKIASNDRKVRSLIERLGLKISIIQTPELLFRWAQQTQASRERVRIVLENVTARARFSPGKQVPYAKWWYSILKSE